MYTVRQCYNSRCARLFFSFTCFQSTWSWPPLRAAEIEVSLRSCCERTTSYSWVWWSTVSALALIQLACIRHKVLVVFKSLADVFFLKHQSVFFIAAEAKLVTGASTGNAEHGEAATLYNLQNTLYLYIYRRSVLFHNLSFSSAIQVQISSRSSLPKYY